MDHGYSLAQPGRSYRSGGKRGEGGFWCACDDPATWELELDALRVMSRTRDDFLLLKRELRSLRDLAAEGKLYYGPDSDVVRSQSADLILELRFRRRLEYPDGGTKVVRLYFSEPAHMRLALVAAKLAVKSDDDGGLEAQTQHMAEAQLRILKFLGV